MALKVSCTLMWTISMLRCQYLLHKSSSAWAGGGSAILPVTDSCRGRSGDGTRSGMSDSRLTVVIHRFIRWLHCPKPYWSLSWSVAVLRARKRAKRPLYGANLSSWPALVSRKVANTRRSARPASGKRLIWIKPKVEFIGHITDLAGATGLPDARTRHWHCWGP
jgi:hypothetical protein